MPWLLAALIDYRRTDLDLMVAELSRLMSSDELNDEWFGTPFWNLLERDKEALRSPDVTQAIWLWSWETLCTACQNEFTHSRNKRRADASLSWSNFVAVSYNQEAQRRTQWQLKAQLGTNSISISMFLDVAVCVCDPLLDHAP